MMPKPIRSKTKILLNVLHTSGGGGQIYMQNLLPFFAADTRFDWVLLAQPELLKNLNVPKNITIKTAPNFKNMRLGFLAVHGWEQGALPILARIWRCKAMWCNANYGPIFAPNPIPTLHTTTRAGAFWPGLLWRVYWGALRSLTWALVRRARVVFAVAGHVAAEYPASGITKKLAIASPAVNISGISPHVYPQPTVVAVGDFYEQKNYVLLVQAFAVLHSKMPDVKLHIIGRPVWPQVVNAVDTEIIKRGLQNVVEISPGLPHAQTLAHVAGASLLANTSRAECFNMPLLEALALGVPVVCGDYDFQHDVVADAAVFVPMDSGHTANALAVAMFGVLQNPAIAATLQRRGLERAAQFSWQKTAEVILHNLAQHFTH